MAAGGDDNRGIVAPGELMSRVHFRRLDPAPELRSYVEFYWFIDWDLDEPYESKVVPHPAVNIVFQRHGNLAAFGEVSGVGLELFTTKLTDTGRVCGARLRPGAYPVFGGTDISQLTGRRVPIAEVFPDADSATPAILDPPDENVRAAALDTFLNGLSPVDDPLATKANALVEHIRADRTLRRVDEVAATAAMSVRAVQRLFAGYVGVGPKWVIRRYRLHDAVDQAGIEVDWARLATDLGYSDQAHLVRDFTAMLGTPPAAFARAMTR